MRREHRGRQRNNNTKTFPYEPLVMGGRLVMPAELQRVHRAALGGAQITDDMRAVVEKRWPELIAKLAPLGIRDQAREALRRTALRQGSPSGILQRSQRFRRLVQTMAAAGEGRG